LKASNVFVSATFLSKTPNLLPHQTTSTLYHTGLPFVVFDL